MWRYPIFSAAVTASAARLPSCEVPNPIAGIVAPCAVRVGEGDGMRAQITVSAFVVNRAAESLCARR
jgi:hypothetical protein